MVKNRHLAEHTLGIDSVQVTAFLDQVSIEDPPLGQMVDRTSFGKLFASLGELFFELLF